MTRVDPVLSFRWLWRAEPEHLESMEALRAASLPGGFRGHWHARTIFRDVYLDTAEQLLERHGIRCRLRHVPDGRTILTVRAGPDQHELATLSVIDARPERFLQDNRTLRAALRAIVDPASLAPILEIHVEREVRLARWRLWPTPTALMALDRARVGGEGGVGGDMEWQEVAVASLGHRGPSAARLVAALRRAHAWRPRPPGTLERGRAALEARERAVVSTQLRSRRESVVLLLSGEQIGLVDGARGLSVPWQDGEGEAVVRHLLGDLFGTQQAQVRRLGAVPARPWRKAMDVWLARRLPAAIRRDPRIRWLSLDRAIQLAGTPMLGDARALAALQLAVQSDLRHETPDFGRALALPPPANPAPDPASGTTERFLDPDLSLLEFHRRVLALARDPAWSPMRRLEYLAIVAANLDEFFMVRVAALKRAAMMATDAEDGSGPNTAHSAQFEEAARLDAIRLRAHALHMEVYREMCSVVRPALEAQGISLRGWGDVTPVERGRLSARFAHEIAPRLHPFILGPRHPFPHLAPSETALAVTLRDADTDERRVAVVRFPTTVPRALPLDVPGHWILVEDLVCAHAELVFPGLQLLRAHMFRVTRSADVRYAEHDVTDALHLVTQAIEQRPFLPVVRLEVDRRMPADQRSRLLQEFRFEAPDRVSDLEASDVVEIDDLVALQGLREIVAASHVREESVQRAPFDGEPSVFGAIAARDHLVHFPYESFDASVVRLLDEAACDPHVETIQLTLYRTNEQSPVLDALLEARQHGKHVIVVVELKARFDESRNIDATQRLRSAGVQVVLGVPGLKLHAKMLLVDRGEPDGLRRYAFLGSGNFNPVTARRYTDVGLFTCRPALTDEVHALFSAMRGGRRWPVPSALLVSPVELLPRLVALIDREADHARAGRPAGIRFKLNGLDDPEVVEALYRASQAGVRCELIVRGLCTLRPGVPGLSQHIHVISILGEFLEHARILHFVNGGDAVYFIGSADLRARNLRRRVEVLAPVHDEVARQRLAYILDAEWHDPTAWTLLPDGSWLPGTGQGDVGAAQRRFRRSASADEWRGRDYADVTGVGRSVGAALPGPGRAGDDGPSAALPNNSSSEPKGYSTRAPLAGSPPVSAVGP